MEGEGEEEEDGTCSSHSQDSNLACEMEEVLYYYCSSQPSMVHG